MWDDKPVQLDVSNPKSFRIPAAAKRVWFISSSDQQDIDVEGVRAVIAGDPLRHTIEGLSYAWTYKLRSLEAVSLFPAAWEVSLHSPNLTGLEGLEKLPRLSHLNVLMETRRRSLRMLPQLPISTLILRVTKPQDVQYLRECKQLGILSLLGWPLPDLSSIANLTLTTLRLNGGSTIRTEGLQCEQLDNVQLVGCTKLRNINGIRTRVMTINGCQNVDLTTMNANSGLKYLWLLGRREVTSLSFLNRCPDLVSLEISSLWKATKITANDWHEIIRCRSLKAVWLAGIPDAIVEMIAASRSDLIISNSCKFYVHGSQVSCEEYSRAKIHTEEITSGSQEP